jgi:hypothetical protein
MGDIWSKMQNWQHQPSKQLVSLLKWLFQEVATMHGMGQVHSSLSLQKIRLHPTAGWSLELPEKQGSGSRGEDAVMLARITSFLCLSSEQRREYQPHHLQELTDAQLSDFLRHTPVVQLLVVGLFNGYVAPMDAVTFHLWHPLAVHAQVRSCLHVGLP